MKKKQKTDKSNKKIYNNLSNNYFRSNSEEENSIKSKETIIDTNISPNLDNKLMRLKINIDKKINKINDQLTKKIDTLETKYDNLNISINNLINKQEDFFNKFNEFFKKNININENIDKKNAKINFNKDIDSNNKIYYR